MFKHSTTADKDFQHYLDPDRNWENIIIDE